MKLVLDSNIINYCVNLQLSKSFFDSLECDILIPTYVKDEIINSKNDELISKMKEIEYRKIGFFGFRNNPNALGFGQGSFYRTEYDDFINDTVEKHQVDRLIGTLSKINGAVFITADKKAFRDCQDNRIDVVFISNDKKTKNKTNSNRVYYNETWTKKHFKEMIKDLKSKK